MLGLVAMVQAAPPPKKNGRSSQPAAAAVSAEDLQALKDAVAAQQQQIEAQQQQIEQLRQELGQKDANWRDAQQRATEAQGRLSAIESKNNQGDEDVANLKSDLADVKTTLTNTAVTTQDEQKRVSGVEGVLSRFRLNGDVRVRYENFLQSYDGCAAPNCNPRHRERLRVRAGFEGKLSEDFYGGAYFATGSLEDPVSTNQTLTGFFGRKPIGWDRGWVTYQPRSHKWLQLTGGKFAYTWARTPLTFDADLNPEGFSQKFSFDVPNRVLKNVTFTGLQLLLNESSTGADSFAAGGQVSTRLQLGNRVMLSPAVTLLNWRNTDAIAAAVANKTLAGNVMTNASTPDKKQFLSRFLYNDYILDAAVKTPWSRFPMRLLLDYVTNLNAASSRRHGYWVETAFGQTKEKGDIQFGYTWARIEQDAVISAFNESDLRAPTNVLQHRLNFQYQVARNTTLSYTSWFGRTLDRTLQNAQTPTGLGKSAQDPLLTRMQLDVIYKF